MRINTRVEALYDKDNMIGYKNLQELERLSEENNSVYEYIGQFIDMLDSEISFVRVRGFRLICKNAKWDDKNIINKSIEKILEELEDEKPTAVRQCLAAIKDVIKYKKELNVKIKKKILTINYLKYNDSMQGLIAKDVDDVLKEIDSNTQNENLIKLKGE